LKEEEEKSFYILLI